nr:hypothetical protein [Desulfobacula sp.]
MEKILGKKNRTPWMSLLVVNFALLILFLIQDRPGIWTWYSLINIIGLNGLLNWFKIQNLSPFGAGMWFFTLLLIFYLSYPFLEKMNSKLTSIFCGFFILLAYSFSLNIDFGHALWLTACGFIVGTWAGKIPSPCLRISA